MYNVLIIAEIGSIHDGSFGNALKAIELAKFVGADAVKFQTHLAEHETVKGAPMPSYFKGEPRYDYFKRTSFSINQWKEIRDHCGKVGIEFISSPFSIEAVGLLDEVGVSRFKIPSGEVTNLEMLSAVSKTGKSVILSSGMNNWAELDQAVEVLRSCDLSDLAVLQCSSIYPCPLNQVGLNVMDLIKRRYDCVSGLSDHAQSNYASLAAVALGAKIIEKHLTFSQHMYGSDAPFAAEPDQFSEMVLGVRAISEMAACPVDKDDLSIYTDMKRVFEKSIVAKGALKKGQTLEREVIALKKPGGGLPASQIETIIGRRLSIDVDADQQIHLEHLEK